MDKVYQKGLSIFLVLIMVMGGISGVIVPSGGTAHAATTVFAGGTGTKGDPYQIATADQLDLVRHHLEGGLYFELTANIDLSDINWEPIGTYDPNNNVMFHGNIDGNGFKITNLMINRQFEHSIGLFGALDDGGSITNVILEDINVNADGDEGGLVGANFGTISNSYAAGIVNSDENGDVGGLVGANVGTISNSYAAVKVSGSDAVGGLVGLNVGTISNSYASGSIQGIERVGGLVGWNDNGTINTSYATGNVSGTNSVGGVGGLVGFRDNGNINYSFYDSITTGQIDTGKGTGKTTSEMQDPNTFRDWDFSEDWYMLTGHYPELWAFIALTPGTNGGTTKLTGVSSEMEYKVNTGSYTPIVDTSVDNIVVGVGDKIYLRVKGASQSAYDHMLIVAVQDINIVTIQSAAVAGVTAPVAGATPVTNITYSEYTATVSWSPATTLFVGDTAYTATVTITPIAGYTLAGVPANFFTVAGAIQTTNAADSGIVTAVFPATAVVPIPTGAIAGVTAPVAGATPVTNITYSEYTATVSWSPATTLFVGDTAYTATITITPIAGYTLAGVAKDFFKVAGATTTNAADSGDVTAVFPATAAVPIKTAAIEGVIVPVAGGVPNATVPETAEYTASIAWTPAAATFAGGTAYTATITITPKPGYTLAGVPEYFFSVPGAITVNTVGSGVVIAEFPATAIVPVTAIPITAARIAGITEPEAGATPVTAVTYSSEYTATLTWSPTTTLFVGETVYTAKITITPTAGYTLTGVSANFFTVAGATTTNDADSGVVTAVFSATVALPVTEVPVTEVPVTTVPIATSGISGVTVPVTGATPVTTVTYSAEYTATVSWSPATTLFIGGTAYTATITITPKAGYTITGVAANFFTIAGASTTNTAESGVVTAVFPATAPVAADTGTGSTFTTSTNNIVTSTNGVITLSVNQSGEVSFEDTVKISIPAGAAVKEVILSIQKVLDPQDLFLNNEILLSPVYEITKNFAEDFSKLVTLNIAFDPTLVKSNQKAAVFYYDEVKKAWVEVAGGKIEGNHIMVEVNHFGKYAVLSVDKVTGLPVRASVTESPTEIILSDIAGHWAEAYIKQAVSIGMVKGYTDGTFQPNHTVTRAEFSVMLMNVLRPQGEAEKLNFTDTAKIGAWAQTAIAQAVQAGIITGYEDGGFRPNAEITRAEMAVILAKALGESTGAKLTTSFADDKDIPTWAKSSVGFVKQAGMVQGKGENEFAPQASATRAEAVTVLLKLLAQQSN